MKIAVEADEGEWCVLIESDECNDPALWSKALGVVAWAGHEVLWTLRFEDIAVLHSLLWSDESVAFAVRVDQKHVQRTREICAEKLKEALSRWQAHQNPDYFIPD